MFSETVQTLGDQAAAKVSGQKLSLPAHLIRSMLAGMYVGAAIVLIFTVGGLLSPYAPGAVRLLMGVCFGGALTIVIFAGSELFTGSNLILPLGIATKKATWKGLVSNWVWTWIGNLLGSVLVAWMVIEAGLFDADPIKGFVLRIVETKMNLPPGQLILRAILANWFVCLGVWMSARIKSETARILMIWWCMFTFITSGYEHSIANMCGLMLGLLLPHPETISWGGYAYNLSLATLGNVIGGAIFVGMAYWMGSPKLRAALRLKAVETEPSNNGTPQTPALAETR